MWGSRSIDAAWFKISQDSPAGEFIIRVLVVKNIDPLSPNVLFAKVLTIIVYTMLLVQIFKERLADAVTALTYLDVYQFSHWWYL